MADDPIKAAELHGYSRGYAAGRKRGRLDARFDEDRGRVERFRQEVFLAIISEMIERPWGRQVGEKWVPDKDAKGITQTAWNFADEALKGARFR